MTQISIPPELTVNEAHIHIGGQCAIKLPTIDSMWHMKIPLESLDYHMTELYLKIENPPTESIDVAVTYASVSPENKEYLRNTRLETYYGVYTNLMFGLNVNWATPCVL